MELIYRVQQLERWMEKLLTREGGNGALSRYGGFYAYDKAILLNITVADTYHAIHLVAAGDIVTGIVSGWTFTAGRAVDANISTETNPSGSVLLITCSGNHGLTSGDLVVLGNMNNAGHNKPTRVTVTGLTTFTCNDITYVAGAGASAGTVDEPAQLIAATGADGVYHISFTIDGQAADSNKVYKFEMNKNVSALDNIVSERTSTASIASMTSTGNASIVAGDRIWLSGKNKTDTSDYTIKHLNVNLFRL